jgi:hypothetical protein
MKRACSLNTNTDEYITCEFHPAIKNKLYTDETTPVKFADFFDHRTK